jgi:hypothetical protein
VYKNGQLKSKSKTNTAIWANTREQRTEAGSTMCATFEGAFIGKFALIPAVRAPPATLIDKPDVIPYGPILGPQRRKWGLGVKGNENILLYGKILVVQEWYKSEINNTTQNT